MATWRNITIVMGLFAAALLTAGVLLATAPPRGKQVELLPAPTAAPIVVNVSGEVNQPGLYTLPPGSRLEAAVKAAGGYTFSAQVEQINLAKILKDGDHVIIPSINDSPSRVDPLENVLETQPESGMLININTATIQQLQELPGIGETKAERIIAYREAHEGFRSIEEIQEVEGIGPETYERLMNLITID